MFFSIIPDIIDKPLALMYPTLGSGRTVGHSLAFLSIITLILGIALIYRHQWVVWGAMISVFFHQIFDELWKLPSTWFYPVFGPFLIDMGIGTPEHWFWVIFRSETTSPVEWISGILIVIILVVLRREIHTKSIKCKSVQSSD